MLFLYDACGDLEPVIKFMKSVLSIIQWGIPILLIIMGSIDLGKAVLASDDKEIKGATSRLVKRAIAAIAIFFVPMLVNTLIRMVASDGADTGSGDQNFIDCWAYEGKTSNT